MEGPFGAFALLLLICALAGALVVRLKQPVLIAYIVVGIAVGPAVWGLVGAHDPLGFGIAFGVVLTLALGKGLMGTLYGVVALAWSSTIIIKRGRYGSRLLRQPSGAGVERVLNPPGDEADRAAQTLASRIHRQERPA